MSGQQLAGYRAEELRNLRRQTFVAGQGKGGQLQQEVGQVLLGFEAGFEDCSSAWGI